MEILHTERGIGISRVFVEISSMEIRFTTINCTLGIRQHTFILLQFVQEWKDENDMREKRKKNENLLCKNCLISFHEIREYQACNIGKRKYKKNG